MYEFTAEATEKEYSEFLERTPHYSVMQAPQWAEVKSGWGHSFCLLYKDGTAAAGALLLIRKLPMGIKIIYSPRGYVADYSNKELIRAFTQGVKAYAKKIGAYVIKIDPEITLSRTYLGSTTPDEDGIEQMRSLTEEGYLHMGFDKGFSKYAQPRYNAVYSLTNEDGSPKTDEQILAGYNRRIRKYIGEYTRKRGLSFIHSTDEEKIGDFMALSACTEKRQHILQRDEAYFRRMKHAYGDKNIFFFARMNFDELLAHIDAALKKDDANKESLLKDRQRALELKAEYGDETPVSAMNTVMCSDTVYFMYSGFNDQIFSRYRSTLQIRYEAMRYFRDMGMKYASFMGIHGDLNDSLAEFKLKFNPTVTEFAGEFELPVKPLMYKIMTKALPAARRIYIKLMLKLKGR